MVYLSILLHIYQPPTQFDEITKKITNDSYRLILDILNKTKGRITLNIPGSLTEQLVKNKDLDVIWEISKLCRKKQLEFTATAAYHPLLPRLPQSEIKRQIELNNIINIKYFGADIYCPKGFFPPEMAYSSRMDKVLIDNKTGWVILDEYGYKRQLGLMSHWDIYINKHKNNTKDNNNMEENGTKNNIKYFFRDDDLSNCIALSQVKTISDFDCKMETAYSGKDSYSIIAMDGETFGHHQRGQDKLLNDILCSNKYKIVLISEIEKYFRNKIPIRPLISSWGSGKEDMRKKIYWTKWSFPKNRIQMLQWRLLKLALKMQINRLRDQSSVRHKLDMGLHSDQFWWASKRPYWHPEMVRRGAKLLYDFIIENHYSSQFAKKDAERIYNEIVERTEI
jgi:alpha-amylase/alpha-mannosidase (GH57 family)